MRILWDMFRISWVSILWAGFAITKWQECIVLLRTNIPDYAVIYLVLLQFLWVAAWIVPFLRIASRSRDFEIMGHLLRQYEGRLGDYRVAKAATKLISRGRADVLHCAVMRYGAPENRSRAYLRQYYDLPWIDKLKIPLCARVYHWFWSVL